MIHSEIVKLTDYFKHNFFIKLCETCDDASKCTCNIVYAEVTLLEYQNMGVDVIKGWICVFSS